MEVKFLDLQAQHARIAAEIAPAMAEVVKAQNFVLGRQVKEFEESFARYLGAEHAVGLASGSDALVLRSARTFQPFGVSAESGASAMTRRRAAERERLIV